MRRAIVTVAALLWLTCAAPSHALDWVSRPAMSFDDTARAWVVTFELDALSDVEVSIVDPASGVVVRHLAAGVLGANPPAPLAKDMRKQTLTWDGKDDYGQAVANAKAMKVRVRAKMSAALEKIVGGDPYAYFSKDTGHADHGVWGINGLEIKPDGKVYVLGHTSKLGPPAIRQYDADGNYLRTVFPPPAGKDPKRMKGWGIHVKPDGTYTPRFNRLTDPSLSTTILDTDTGGMGRLFPTPEADRLTVWHTGFGNATFAMMSLNTDGTIDDDGDQTHAPLVKNPPFELGPIELGSHIRNVMVGPVFTCMAADGKHFYLTGLFAATARYGSIQEIKSDGFWRDGQVWKVDLATRTAKPFFTLDAAAVASAPRDRKSAIGGRQSYAALHGVAVDGDGHVFVCDRLNRRIAVLDEAGKVVREIPVEHADAIAVSMRTGALYVTTRIGDEYTGRGEVNLLKFNDWRKDDKPSVSLTVSETGYTGHFKQSYVAVCEKGDASNVWVAYTEMPVRVYRDDARGFTLLKDFAAGPGARQAFVMDRIAVDQKTDAVYVLNDFTDIWKVADWREPKFVKIPLRTASVVIDSRNRYLFARTMFDGGSSNSVGKIARFHIDDENYAPANYGDSGTNRLTPSFRYEWCFTGNSDRGFAFAPNGNLAVLAQDGGGALLFYHGDASRVPWEPTTLAKLGTYSGGIQFDLRGNLYVGAVGKGVKTTLPGFDDDPMVAKIGRIYKYAPTGTLESGNLFPQPPGEPAQVYDVPFGAFDADCIVRTPRFSVDGFGRIYYPTNIAQRVAVIDNAGNEILHFGTYGNRDSTGGLAGDLVPTRDIPLAFPNSVDATDNYIYVGDMVNHRLLRVRKVFALDVTSK